MELGNISNLVMAALFVSLFLLGLVGFVGEMAVNYNMTDFDETTFIKASASQATKTTSLIANMTHTIASDQPEEIGLLEVAGLMIGSGFYALKLPLVMAQILANLLSSLFAPIWFIPPVAFEVIIAAISFILITTIVAAVIKWKL